MHTELMRRMEIVSGNNQLIRKCTTLVCVCNWFPGCVILPNHEVVGFHPRSRITTDLDSVDYCYVSTHCIPFYSSHQLIHRKEYSTHLDIIHLHFSISSHRTRSSSHLGVARLHPSIIDFSIYCPLYYPWPLMIVPLALSPPPCLPQYFIQVFPKMWLYCLLMPPCVPPDPSPLLYLLSCAHLKNCLQRHSL